MLQGDYSNGVYQNHDPFATGGKQRPSDNVSHATSSTPYYANGVTASSHMMQTSMPPPSSHSTDLRFIQSQGGQTSYSIHLPPPKAPMSYNSSQVRAQRDAAQEMSLAHANNHRPSVGSVTTAPTYSTSFAVHAANMPHHAASMDTHHLAQVNSSMVNFHTNTANNAGMDIKHSTSHASQSHLRTSPFSVQNLAAQPHATKQSFAPRSSTPMAMKDTIYANIIPSKPLQHQLVSVSPHSMPSNTSTANNMSQFVSNSPLLSTNSTIAENKANWKPYVHQSDHQVSLPQAKPSPSMTAAPVTSPWKDKYIECLEKNVVLNEEVSKRDLTIQEQQSMVDKLQNQNQALKQDVFAFRKVLWELLNPATLSTIISKTTFAQLNPALFALIDEKLKAYLIEPPASADALYLFLKTTADGLVQDDFHRQPNQQGLVVGVTDETIARINESESKDTCSSSYSSSRQNKNNKKKTNQKIMSQTPMNSQWDNASHMVSSSHMVSPSVQPTAVKPNAYTGSPLTTPSGQHTPSADVLVGHTPTTSDPMQYEAWTDLIHKYFVNVPKFTPQMTTFVKEYLSKNGLGDFRLQSKVPNAARFPHAIPLTHELDFVIAFGQVFSLESPSLSALKLLNQPPLAKVVGTYPEGAAPSQASSHSRHSPQTAGHKKSSRMSNVHEKRKALTSGGHLHKVQHSGISTKPSHSNAAHMSPADQPASMISHEETLVPWTSILREKYSTAIDMLDKDSRELHPLKLFAKEFLTEHARNLGLTVRKCQVTSFESNRPCYGIPAALRTLFEQQIDRQHGEYIRDLVDALQVAQQSGTPPANQAVNVDEAGRQTVPNDQDKTKRPPSAEGQARPSSSSGSRGMSASTTSHSQGQEANMPNGNMMMYTSINHDASGLDAVSALPPAPDQLPSALSAAQQLDLSNLISREAVNGLMRYDIILRNLYHNYCMLSREIRQELKQFTVEYLSQHLTASEQEMPIKEQMRRFKVYTEDGSIYTYGIPTSWVNEYVAYATEFMQRQFGIPLS